MSKLDSPITTGSNTNAVLWTTVSKGGQRYNLQVFLDRLFIENAVASLIEANPSRDHIEAENGSIKVNLVRQP